MDELTDGPGPETYTPASAEEVADILRAAADAGHSVTMSRDGAADSASRIDLQDMTSVVDYPARDMTITVQAGMPVGRLSEVLAEEKQQLPIDFYDPKITIGAMVASNTAGSRQFGYGTLRDYLIGMEAVDGQGRIFHAGGRVVKNVAGYDLCRLMVGSRGSLGVLTQLTFKLKPLPEQTCGSSFHFADADDVEKALERLNVSNANSVIVDLEITDSIAFLLHLAVEGNRDACEWQLEQIRNDCRHSTEVPFAGNATSTVEEYCRVPSNFWAHGAIRVQTLPSNAASVAASLAALGLACCGHAGNGILYVQGEDSPCERRKICEGIMSGQSGSVTEWDEDHPINRKDALTLRIRKAFDPQSVFVK